MSLLTSSLHSRKSRVLSLFSLASLASALVLSGCGGTSADVSSGGSGTAPAFVIGTDAPLAAVTSFAVQINSIDAIASDGTVTNLISGTPTVDFARFNGLQTLIDMNDVQPGTYTKVVVNLGPATIGYLNTTPAPPAIVTEPATLSTSTINYTLPTPLTLTAAAPLGLHLDFDVAKSVQLDSNGQITGNVTPHFNISVVGPTDTGAYLDEFDAAVTSVNVTGQSFTVTGPHGRSFTVDVSGSTEWDNSESLSALTTSSIVQISGELDRVDATIDADEVAILSQNGFYAAGLVTYVTPSSGAATSFDLYVRGLLPTTTGLTLGQIAQINLTGSEKFFIYWMHNPLTQFLFNSSALLPGQHVAVGGPASGATNSQAVTVNRVVLRHWGYNGTVVASSNNTTAGTFQMQVSGFAGVLIPQTVTVYVGNCSFRDGLTSQSSLNSLPAGTNVRVVGLLLKNTANGQTILLAHYIDQLD
jgi:hypothetical protein